MRQFHPTGEEDALVVVGRLEDDAYSGVYLSTAYLDRMRESMYAVSKLLETVDHRTVPEPIMVVVAAISRLIRVHNDQLQAEGYPGTDADRAALAEAEADMKKSLEELRRFHPNDDGGSDA